MDVEGKLAGSSDKQRYTRTDSNSTSAPLTMAIEPIEQESGAVSWLSICSAKCRSWKGMV